MRPSSPASLAPNTCPPSLLSSCTGFPITETNPTTRAGFPTTSACGGTFFVTTAPPPPMQYEPTPPDQPPPPRRIPPHGRMRRHILRHDGARSHHAIRTQLHAAHNRHIRAD